MSGLRLSLRLLSLIVLAAIVALPAASFAAGKPPAKKKGEAAAPADVAPAGTPAAAPASPVTKPAEPAAKPEAAPEPPPPSATPFGDDGPKTAAKAKDDEDEPAKSMFEGFFLNLNLGYATAGGKDGPDIPALSMGGNNPPAGTPSLAQQALAYPEKYKRAVTTNKGSGFALALQIGYNIKGYVSLWADISGHGSLGASTDQAGLVTAAAMLGFHPLRFVKKGQLPVDVKLYGGYGFFELLGYQETEFQSDAKGKAWLGTSIPFGLSTEYKFDKKGVFAMGLDLRFVAASYDKWVYNNDKDISSHLTTPETTFRFEPRVMFGWHL